MKNDTAQQNQTTEPVNPAPTPVETKSPEGTQKTLILIGGLALITIILLIAAVFVGLPQKSTPKTTPVVLKTILNISKPVASSSAYSADITLTTERKNVTAVQLELTFDPKVLTQVDIKSGSYFPDPVILSKKIDPLKGRITYILGIGLGQKPIASNKGTIAVLSFTPLLKSGIATISFLPTSRLTVSGQVHTVLTGAHGIIFSLGQ